MVKPQVLVRMVGLQFNISNFESVPASLPYRDKGWNTPQQPGKLVLSPKNNTDGSALLNDLAECGYQLVECFYQERENSLGDYAYSVRYVFVQDKYVEAEDLLPVYQDELQQLLREAFWNTKGYLNPFFQNGLKVDGQAYLSINFAGRNPRIENGKPRMVWPTFIVGGGKDKSRGKVPLSPSHFLRFNGFTIFPEEEFVAA